jgi:hypothetical protein
VCLDLVRRGQQRVDDQRARLRSMIVRDFPAQSAEDLLRRYDMTLRQLSDADGIDRDGANLPPLIPCASNA